MRGPREGIGNLPSATASFVGRRAEIAEVRRCLGRARLVTLTGGGGVGKTRLALEVGHAVLGGYPDGVWFADLATLRDPARVAQTVASAAGVLDASARPAAARLADHLADRRALLVFDNCEHLLAACVELVELVLRAAPEVRVLATSRETLELPGEHVHAVPPLADEDAVRLLGDRAAGLRAGFQITSENRDIAARLCARLDGNPLAIELAATRLRTLSLPDLVERLDDRFALLSAGRRTAVPRQQTLRALIDWSHALCSPAEQLLWARLSAFAGSFDLRAAEGICSSEDLPEESVLDLLDRLVARSIVLSEHRPGGTRFRLLETIRAYGRERLAELGEESPLQDRHLAFYLARARAIAGAWCGPGQESGLAQLRADHADLGAALETSFEGRDTAAYELTVALRHHWYADGFLAEGRRWLDRALALPAPDATDARAAALWVVAWVALLQGDRDVAGERLDECEGLAAPDSGAQAYVRMLRGTAALFGGELPEACTRFREAVDAGRVLGEPSAMLAALFQLGHALAQLGDLEGAEVACREGLDASERYDEHWARAALLWTLAYVAWLRREPSRAAELNRRSLEIQRGFHDGVLSALSIELSAWTAASRGDVPRAAELLAAAESVWTEMGTSIRAFGAGHSEHHERCARLVGRARRAPRRRTIADAIAVALDDGAAAPDVVDRGGLTEREWEVAQLVADGMTNREIASRLVLSHRTVDGHLERILAKLGAKSRTQVAAWAAERRLVTPG